MTSPDLVIRALDTELPVFLPSEGGSALREALEGRWNRCLDESTPTSVTAEALTLTGVGEDPTPRLSRITQEITGALISAQAGRLLMFHAGAVANPRTGASLVFAAPGGTGKTTLAKALGRRFGYLSDETVGMSAEGLIYPYPKPLSLRITGTMTHKDESSPDSLGLLPAPAAPRLARLVLIRRDESLRTPIVEEPPLLDSLARLIPESSSLARLPRPLHLVAELVERTGPIQAWTYSEAGDLVALVTDLLGEA